MQDRDEVLEAAMRSLLEVIGELKCENDRAAVIVGAAYLDDLLRRLLQASLLPAFDKKRDELLDSDSALQGFSSKINLSYRLALIDRDLRSKLHVIRGIRNDFAHKMKGCDLSSTPHSDKILTISSDLACAELLTKLRELFPGDHSISRDFRIVLALIVAVLEMKLMAIPTSMKANPASLKWLPPDVDVPLPAP